MKQACIFLSGIAALSLFYVAFKATSGSKIVWDIDFYFTERLFSTGTFKESDNQNRNINVVQAFMINNAKNDFLSLEELNKNGELVFETRSNLEVIAIVSALHEKRDAKLRCNEERPEKTMHVLAYDRQLMKVAYFLSYSCMSNQGNEIDALVVPDRSLGLSVFYNKSIGQILRR